MNRYYGLLALCVALAGCGQPAAVGAPPAAIQPGTGQPAAEPAGGGAPGGGTSNGGSLTPSAEPAVPGGGGGGGGGNVGGDPGTSGGGAATTEPGLAWATGPVSRTAATAFGPQGAYTPHAYLADMARADLTVRSFAQMALGRARDPEVRAYAERVMMEQDALGARIRDVAGARGLELPGSFSAWAPVMRERLATTADLAFDRHFMAFAVVSHENAVRRSEAAVAFGDDGLEVTEFAEALLPDLRERLDDARAIADRVQADRADLPPGWEIGA